MPVKNRINYLQTGGLADIKRDNTFLTRQCITFTSKYIDVICKRPKYEHNGKIIEPNLPRRDPKDISTVVLTNTC